MYYPPLLARTWTKLGRSNNSYHPSLKVRPRLANPGVLMVKLLNARKLPRNPLLMTDVNEESYS
jgi:hypothetical protein